MINFKSLIPTVIQDFTSGEVYMLGYMNEESLEKTRQTGYVWFFSRSKNRLWMKGEQSENKLKVKQILVDCDKDSMLIKVELDGKNVCHTGERSCFSKKL